MSTRVNKPIIGKDLLRTETLVIEGATQNLAAGEVFVADKNRVLVNASATIADTDTIYIGVGLNETHDYTLPDGSAVITARKILWSTPIQGTKVLAYTGLSGGSAATEAVVTLDTSGITPVVGTEYVVRIVYKDMPEHPGQFTQTYRHTATAVTAATATTLVTALKAEINSAGVTANEARVIASGTDDLVLTGKVIPNNETNEEIDEYSQVDFVVGSWSITAAGVKTIGLEGAAVVYTTLATPGIGNPKIVRDKEKLSLGYKGITNTINFPVIKPTMLTDMAEWYDVIVIEHDTDYESGETQYIQSTPCTTEIYIPTGAGQTSTTAIAGASLLEVLNPWMASTPKTFGAVSV